MWTSKTTPCPSANALTLSICNVQYSTWITNYLKWVKLAWTQFQLRTIELRLDYGGSDCVPLMKSGLSVFCIVMWLECFTNICSEVDNTHLHWNLWRPNLSSSRIPSSLTLFSVVHPFHLTYPTFSPLHAVSHSPKPPLLVMTGQVCHILALLCV